ncbi:hypothetical protein [Actinoplanes sp. CA-252034]
MRADHSRGMYPLGADEPSVLGQLAVSRPVCEVTASAAAGAAHRFRVA